MLLGLALSMMLLNACATGQPNASASVVEYSKEEQARVADDLQLTAPDSPLRRWIPDYIRLRDQVRAGRK